MKLRQVTMASILLMGGTLAHADPVLTAGASLSFFQGTFGTNSNIDIRYDSTYVQYGDANWRVKLMVPYVSESGLPNGATLSGGAVVGGTGSSQTHSASGLGDVWLSSHYRIYQGSGLMPSISPYAKIKFGTASAADGLGTGRNDYEVGLGLQQTIGTTLFPFANIGYREVGNPTGQHLRNIATYQLGVSYVATQRNIFSALFSGSQAITAGAAAPADLILAWNYNVTQAGSGLQFFVDKGLSNGSANYGVGIGGQIVF